MQRGSPSYISDMALESLWGLAALQACCRSTRIPQGMRETTGMIVGAMAPYDLRPLFAGDGAERAVRCRQVAADLFDGTAPDAFATLDLAAQGLLRAYLEPQPVPDADLADFAFAMRLAFEAGRGALLGHAIGLGKDILGRHRDDAIANAYTSLEMVHAAMINTFGKLAAYHVRASVDALDLALATAVDAEFKTRLSEARRRRLAYIQQLGWDDERADCLHWSGPDDVFIQQLRDGGGHAFDKIGGVFSRFERFSYQFNGLG